MLCSTEPSKENIFFSVYAFNFLVSYLVFAVGYALYILFRTDF